LVSLAWVRFVNRAAYLEIWQRGVFCFEWFQISPESARKPAHAPRQSRSRERSNDGSHFPGIPKPDHEPDQGQEHETRNRSTTTDPRDGLPVSFASQESARNPGLNVSRPKKSHLCSRVLLAPAQLPERHSACIEHGILEPEARPKRAQRQKKPHHAETERLVRSRAMGMRNEGTRGSDQSDCGVSRTGGEALQTNWSGPVIKWMTGCLQDAGGSTRRDAWRNSEEMRCRSSRRSDNGLSSCRTCNLPEIPEGERPRGG